MWQFYDAQKEKTLGDEGSINKLCRFTMILQSLDFELSKMVISL